MTPNQFRDKLDSLGLTQAGVSRLMQVEDRSVRRWASGERPVPGFAIAFLGLLEACPPALKLARKLAIPSPGAAREPADRET